jgi:hypothetical protein
MKKPKKLPVERKDPMGYYKDWIERRKHLVQSVLQDHVITTTKKEDL